MSDFSNLKALKNKLEKKFYTQGQSIQTAQMMQKHIKLRDKHSDKDLGVPKKDFLKTMCAAQPALYDANVMLKPNHDPPEVSSSEEIEELESVNREKLEE